MKSKILFFSFLISLSACNEEIPEFKQEIMFGLHYTNWAWGYQNNGFLIDSLGDIRAFDLSKKTIEWNNPDSNGYITKERMIENLSYCDSIINRVNPDTLNHYVGKIWKASKGNISKPQMQMADFGQLRYSAYIFDRKTNRYKEILIKDYGDWLITNDAIEAEEIYRWMNRIRQN